jgi:hypothetical protein
MVEILECDIEMHNYIENLRAFTHMVILPTQHK